MKNLLSKAAVMVAAGMFVIAGAATASSEPTVVRFDVPFAFLAGGEMHAAGSYYASFYNGFYFVDLRSANETHTQRVPLAIKGVSRKATDNSPATLQFHIYGKRAVLTAVWNQRRSDGNEVKLSAEARELARTGSPERISIVTSK
jgi:hypothetical protein